MNIKPPSFYRNNYYATGEVYLVEYLTINGVRHREDGPALTELHRDGTVKRVTYIVNGLTHRIDGPAHIEYNKDGTVIIFQGFYKDGVCLNTPLFESSAIGRNGNIIDQEVFDFCWGLL